MNILFLDDDPIRHDTFDRVHGKNHTIHHVYSANRFREVALYKEFDCVFFDHDLGIGETGYDLAKWFVAQIGSGAIKIPERVFVHSWNIVGAEQIVSVFKQIGVDAIRKPFGEKL